MTTFPLLSFHHPPLGTVGLTEPQAREKYGNDIRIFETQFTPMTQALNTHPIRTAMKLITIASSENVIGCHLIGDNVDEMLRGFAVTLKIGATKSDFNKTIAIHPTSAEELVTL